MAAAPDHWSRTQPRKGIFDLRRPCLPTQSSSPPYCHHHHQHLNYDAHHLLPSWHYEEKMWRSSARAVLCGAAKWCSPPPPHSSTGPHHSYPTTSLYPKICLSCTIQVIVSCLFNGKIRFKGFVKEVISFLKFYFRR